MKIAILRLGFWFFILSLMFVFPLMLFLEGGLLDFSLFPIWAMPLFLTIATLIWIMATAFISIRCFKALDKMRELTLLEKEGEE